MKLSLILAPLIAAKVSHSVIMETVLAFESQQTDALEQRRANDRERQARKRLSRDVTGSHTVSRTHAGVEDSSSKKVISGKEEKEDRAPAARTPCQELESVLDHEHAQAVVDHRQRLKKPLTAYAAKQLASKLSKAPDANVAADAMIANGWQGFEAGWLENRTTRPHSTASPPAQDFNAILDAIQGKTNAAHTGHTIDGSHERTDRGGASGPVQLYAVPSGR